MNQGLAQKGLLNHDAFNVQHRMFWSGVGINGSGNDDGVLFFQPVHTFGGVLDGLPLFIHELDGHRVIFPYFHRYRTGGPDSILLHIDQELSRVSDGEGSNVF